MLLFFAFGLLAFHSLPTDSAETKLVVNVQNIRHHTGQIRVGLYKPCTGFPTGCKPLVSHQVDVTGNTARITFSVKPGDYAVALFHDVNGNGQLDKKMFGIPKEPYGFSNNFRPSLSGPSFDDCRVRVDESEKKISIKLI